LLLPNFKPQGHETKLQLILLLLLSAMIKVHQSSTSFHRFVAIPCKNVPANLG
jgi:hypothetical protein